MDKLKLKWRIFVFLLGFCGLLLIILWLFQTVFLNDMYKLIRTHEINNAISLVEKHINSPGLKSMLKQLEEEKEIFITPANEFILTSRLQATAKVRPIAITQTKEFRLEDGRTLYLTFHAITTPVNATISTLQLQLYCITVIMLLLSIILAIIIAKKISNPIEYLNKSAKVLASGNYNTHFDGKGFLEITELSNTLNTAAHELSRTEALRRELLANISHDLRTPLSLIYSYSEMMHDFPSEITPEQTQIIMDETKRLSSLVSDVLDISKFESESVNLKLQTYNLTESIHSTIRCMIEMTKKDGYSIGFEYNDDAYIKADEVKITQAFYNLLINAVNYSGSDKKITVRQIFTNNSVKIEIEDHGEGIEEKDLAYIWDRYYKVDKNHKRAYTGTGLGLSIVKKIIDLHNGTYGVDSIIGRGSIFWFTIKTIRS